MSVSPLASLIVWFRNLSPKSGFVSEAWVRGGGGYCVLMAYTTGLGVGWEG